MDKKIKVLLAAEKIDREEMLQALNEKELFQWSTAETREELIEQQTDVDIILIASSLKGEAKFISMIKSIPKEIRILFWINSSINHAVVGIMEEHGAEIIENLDQLENILHSKMLMIQEEEVVEEIEPTISLEKTEEQAEVKEEKPKKKVVRMGKQESTPKQQSIIVNYKDSVRELQTTKHTSIVKTEITSAVPEGYKEIIGIFSPLRTGKTEIAAAMAIASSKMKKKTALVDLDIKKFGCRFMFPIDPVAMHEDNLYFEFMDLFEYEKANRERIDSVNYAQYADKNLNVFTALPQNEENRDLEKWIKMINTIIEDHEVIIFDFGDSEIEKELLQRLHMRKFIITTEDVEVLDQWSRKILNSEMTRYTWNIIINQTAKKDVKKVLKHFKSDNRSTMKIDKVLKVPFAKESLKCREQRKYLYTTNKEFKTSIDEIMGHLNYGYLKENRKTKQKNRENGNIFKKTYNKHFTKR